MGSSRTWRYIFDIPKTQAAFSPIDDIIVDPSQKRRRKSKHLLSLYYLLGTTTTFTTRCSLILPRISRTQPNTTPTTKQLLSPGSIPAERKTPHSYREKNHPMSMTHHIPEKKTPIACTYEEAKKKIKLIDHLLTLTGFSLSNVAFCKQIAIPLLVGL